MASQFVECASFQAEIDGTPGANDMPGRLVFKTTADGASSPTERMRIASDGKCTFRTCTASVVGIQVTANGLLRLLFLIINYTGDSSPTVKITTSGTNHVAPALNVEDNFFVYGAGRVSSGATYSNGTGSAANMFIDSTGLFHRSTSSVII